MQMQEDAVTLLNPWHTIPFKCKIDMESIRSTSGSNLTVYLYTSSCKSKLKFYKIYFYDTDDVIDFFKVSISPGLYTVGWHPRPRCLISVFVTQHCNII